MFIDVFDGRICDFLPASISMGIWLTRSHCQNGIQHQHTWNESESKVQDGTSMASGSVFRNNGWIGWHDDYTSFSRSLKFLDHAYQTMTFHQSNSSRDWSMIWITEYMEIVKPGRYLVLPIHKGCHGKEKWSHPGHFPTPCTCFSSFNEKCNSQKRNLSVTSCIILTIYSQKHKTTTQKI